MGNGWHEWPLVLFTVVGQCVVGAVVVTGLAWLAAGGEREKQRRIVRGMLALWLMMGIAFVASMLHLGSPLRAFNALNRIGSSALSNEIASGSLFFAVGGVWWLLAVTGKLPSWLGRVGMVCVMLLGAAFIWSMTRVYQIDTVPTWHNGYTTLGFVLTVFLGGPLLGALLLRAVGSGGNGGRFAALSVAALLVSVTVVILQVGELHTIHSSVRQASALVPDYAALQVWRMALLALGLGGWIYSLSRRATPGPVALAACFALVLAGELIGRALFYGLHMTVGVAVAG